MNRGFINVWVVVGLIVIIGGIVVWWGMNNPTNTSTNATGTITAPGLVTSTNRGDPIKSLNVRFRAPLYSFLGDTVEVTLPISGTSALNGITSQNDPRLKIYEDYLKSLTARIDWGDDTQTAESSFSHSLSTTNHVSHVYQNPGIYKIRLYIKDGVGISAEATAPTVVLGTSQKTAKEQCGNEFAPVCGVYSQDLCVGETNCTAGAGNNRDSFQNRCQMQATGFTFASEGVCQLQ